MSPTQSLAHAGQSLWLDNITRDLLTSGTLQRYIDELSVRWRRALNAGARPQRLLFASTGAKDPKASDILYVKGLVAPLTINTMPEGTLQAFADHGELGAQLRPDGGDSGKALDDFRTAGVDLDALAAKLQEEGAAAFVASWNNLLGVLSSKCSSLARAS